jgi:hemolysin-activating ACP:hemolysin acyltransferase
MVSTNGVAAEGTTRMAPPQGSPQAGAGTAPMTEKVRRQAAAMQNAFAFSQVAGVMMRSKRYRQCTLADLESMVIPPLLAGQFRIGEVKLDKEDRNVPGAVVLWASVSAEVDQRLMQADALPVQLKAEEWKSGDIPWVMHAVGETRVLRQLVERLAETAFKGRELKVLGRNKDGKPVVHLLPANASKA